MKKVIIGSLVLFLSLTAQTCGQTQSTTDTPVNEPVVTQPQLSYYVLANEAQALQSAKDRYNLAFAKAQEWQAEVDLMLVSVTFRGDLANTGVYDRFLFASDLEPDKYFSIDISREDPKIFTRSLIFREDYKIKTGVLPVPVKYWKMSVEKTLEFVDSQGGAQFRNDNSDYKVEMLLSLAGGRNLAWYVVYSAPGVKPFEMIVDANTGSVIENTMTEGNQETDLSAAESGRE